MEIPVGATGPGRISEIHVAVGEQVAAGARLVTLSEH